MRNNQYFLHITDDGSEIYFAEMPDPSIPVISIEIDRGSKDHWMETYHSTAFWRDGGWGTPDGGKSMVWIEGEMLYAVPRGVGWVQTGYRPSSHEDCLGDQHIFQRRRARAA